MDNYTKEGVNIGVTVPEDYEDTLEFWSIKFRR